LEAALAALSSNRLYDLIERFIFSRRNAHSALFDIVPVQYTEVRFLAEADVSSGEYADYAWLNRIELVGWKHVAQTLEDGGFLDRPGTMSALFVDGRCGLISSLMIGAAADADAEQTTAKILRAASRCHAHGIILATHDLDEKVATAFPCRQLTMNLYRKGEATGVFLLDHFILTAAGWKRMFTFKQRERI
jgi:DNA repair protein RadC